MNARIVVSVFDTVKDGHNAVRALHYMSDIGKKSETPGDLDPVSDIYK